MAMKENSCINSKDRLVGSSIESAIAQNHNARSIGGLSNRRPWSKLVDRSAFSKPESVSDATLRIRKNYSYFRTNYLSLIAVVLAFSLITNPFSLFLLAGLLAAWLFLYLFRPSDPPLVLFVRQFSERETLGVLIVLRWS
ncbi:PREDICTED: PRA1 family protein B4-like [Nicotiana attenuata]|uniref:PRA1 family protein B4-like n=1 Tax=Nicotiana attenuata TaxID=49451 RepID=UPI000904845B|nr:PREDICTED: PRA1 family protein B4-like [Nicotiana attenuata]